MNSTIAYGPTSRTLVSADGTEIYAEAVGSRRNPAIVFIHGFSLSSTVFDSIFNDKNWTDRVFLIRYDMRGHGRSGKPDDEASWHTKRLSQDFDAVVNALELERPFVAGWSLGATNIADILSFHSPDYLSGIIYIAPLPYMGSALAKVGTPAALACLPALTQVTDVDAYQHATQTMVSLLSTLMPYAFHQVCLGNYMSQPRAVTALLLSRGQDETQLLKAGQDGVLPMLILIGKRDEIVIGDEVVNAVAGWRDLRVIVMEEADHMPWLGQPNMFRREILGWVEGKLKV